MANDLYSSPVVRFENAQPPHRPEPYEPIVFLLDRMPAVGACWPAKDRRAWLETVASIFNLLYVEDPKDVKIPESLQWWQPALPSQVVLSEYQVEQLVTELNRLKAPTDDELWRKFRVLYPNLRFVFDPEVRTPSSPERPSKAKKSTKTQKARKV